eukprot:Sspe_Gene.2848::Locus_948_Transcript_1_1_Confidence_1.000_Length_2283::g.2848::m.2848
MAPPYKDSDGSLTKAPTATEALVGRGMLGKRGTIARGTLRAPGTTGAASVEGSLFVAAQGLDKLKKAEAANGEKTQGPLRRQSFPFRGNGIPYREVGATKPIPNTTGRAGSAPALRSQEASPGPRQGDHAMAPQPPQARGGAQQKSEGNSKGDSPPGTGTLDRWHYEGRAVGVPGKLPADKVLIHVYDEANHTTQDFVCRRDVLLREMKYFGSYLSQDCPLEELDISVHCDVSIFKWLMEYIHNPVEYRPKQEASVAVSILISSFFLEMDGLVTETLKFVAKHIHDIIKLPIDLDCISKPLIKRLAALFVDEELDRVRDRKDKIVGSLFLHKLEGLLSTTDENGESQCRLMRCSMCGALFTEKQQEWKVCSKSPLFITYNGTAVAEHTPDYNWDINVYLAQLRAKRLSWREIYWRLWALLHDDKCRTCDQPFTYAEIGYCTYHSSPPSFSQGKGVYPCCNTEVAHFEGANPPGKPSGCCARYHLMSDKAPFKDYAMSIICRHSEIVATWPPASEGSSAATLQFAPPQTTEDESDSSTSSGDETFGPEWRRRSRWGAGTYRELMEGDMLRRELALTRKPASTQPAPEEKAQAEKPSRKSRKKKKGQGIGPSAEWWSRQGNKAKSAFFSDCQREEDARRMMSLVASLERLRNDAPDRTGQPLEKKPGPPPKPRKAGPPPQLPPRSRRTAAPPPRSSSVTTR